MEPPVPVEQGGKFWKAKRPRTSSKAEERLRYATQSAFFVRHSATALAADRHHDGEKGIHEGSSHPFSDRFLQSRSVPKPPVETRIHDLFDEAISREEDENEEDGGERGRSRRRARSRRTENLPFLSSPSPQTPMLATFSGQSLLGGSNSSAAEASAPSTPFTGHQLIWSHRYECTLPDSQIAEAGKRKIQTATPLPADEILSRVIEKQRQLYVQAQWYGDDGASSEAGTGKEAVAKLWNIWSDDGVRAACGGRVSVLLDALRLVASDAEQHSSFEISGLATAAGEDSASSGERRSVVVGSDEAHWELRVQTVRHNNVAANAPAEDFVESDLFLVYTHSDVARWQISIDEARNWVPYDLATSRGIGKTNRPSSDPKDPSRASNNGLHEIKPLPNASSLNPTWE